MILFGGCCAGRSVLDAPPGRLYGVMSRLDGQISYWLDSTTHALAYNAAMAGVPGMYIGMAETEEERRAVYRLRYDVYVEEMERYQTVADHKQRMLYEEVDEQSRISYAAVDGEVVATARLTWGGGRQLRESLRRFVSA